LRWIKLIISIFVLWVGILIIGESRMFTLENFYETFDSTTLYVQPATNETNMIEDIYSSAQRNKVEVFTFTDSPLNSFEKQYDIYGTKNVEKYIGNSLNIEGRNYSSLFLGDISFNFHSLDTHTEIEDTSNFYVIGSNKNVQAFKMELIDTYAGNHPEEGYNKDGARNLIISIWSLMILVILILTFYAMEFQKKEYLIKVSLGTSINRLIWQNILFDSITLTVSFISIIFFIKDFTSIIPSLGLSIIMFLVLIVLNSSIYIGLLFHDIRRAFSNSKKSKRLLFLTYGLKSVTAVITIFVISSNIALILESYNLYKQKDFFAEYNEYSYTRLEFQPDEGSQNGNDLIEKIERFQTDFYVEFYDAFNPIVLSSTLGMFNNNGILANKNALPYLKEQIPSLKEQELEKDIYFIAPNNQVPSLIELELALKHLQGENLEYSYEILTYEESVEVITLDENTLYDSKAIKNPVILLNNMDSQQLSAQGDNFVHAISVSPETMYKLSDSAFNDFIKRNNFENELIVRTNVYDNYQNHWVAAKRILLMNFIFSILVLILEFIVIGTILRLEYQVNALELSIKKVLGYDLFSKNKGIISLTLATTLLSIVAVAFTSYFIIIGNLPLLMIGGFSILTLEIALIVLNIKKIENTSVQKILKGGNL
jgi:putative ABC transport system permease protein